ncbi:MAG: methyltransferase domain-containing protein [Methanomassiliicoccales archaeon]|nr:MAG: methyltransferase domain-containing protein [Methanomassiliicoccales archaeon]
MKLTRKDSVSSLNEVSTYYDGLRSSSDDTRDRTKRYIKFNHWIIDILKVKAGKRLLDVACGNGLLLNIAEPLGLKTYGLDISTARVGNAIKRAPKSNIVVAAGECIPYQSNYFDYVTCLGSLEHFLNPDKGCQEIARVLKKDGISCIYVPNTFWIKHVINAWFKGAPPSQTQDIERFATKNEWQELFKDNGLKVVKLCKYNLTPINLSYSFTFLCKKRE